MADVSSSLTSELEFALGFSTNDLHKIGLQGVVQLQEARLFSYRNIENLVRPIVASGCKNVSLNCVINEAKVSAGFPIA